MSEQARVYVGSEAFMKTSLTIVTNHPVPNKTDV